MTPLDLGLDLDLNPSSAFLSSLAKLRNEEACVTKTRVGKQVRVKPKVEGSQGSLVSSEAN